MRDVRYGPEADMTNMLTRRPPTADSPRSFEANDHRLIRRQRLHADVAEAGLVHPADTVHAGEIESSRTHQQHVQTHEQASCIEPPFVVDQALVHDERSGWRQRVICLLE